MQQGKILRLNDEINYNGEKTFFHLYSNKTLLLTGACFNYTI